MGMTISFIKIGTSNKLRHQYVGLTPDLTAKIKINSPNISSTLTQTCLRLRIAYRHNLNSRHRRDDADLRGRRRQQFQRLTGLDRRQRSGTAARITQLLRGFWFSFDRQRPRGDSHVPKDPPKDPNYDRLFAATKELLENQRQMLLDIDRLNNNSLGQKAIAEDMNATIQALDKKYKAAQNDKEREAICSGVAELANGFQAMTQASISLVGAVKSGDPFAISAASLDLAASLVGTVSLAGGPIGAAVGAVLGAILSIVSMILKMFQTEARITPLADRENGKEPQRREPNRRLASRINSYKGVYRGRNKGLLQEDATWV